MFKTDVLFWAYVKPDKMGAFEAYVAQLAAECPKHGIDIRFVFGDDVSDQVDILFKESGVKSHPLPSADLNSARSIGRVLKVTEPKLVHFTFIPHTSTLIPACRLMGNRKLVFTDQLSTPTCDMNIKKGGIIPAIKDLRRKFWARMVDHFIAISDFVANRLKTEHGIPNQKITVVYNGVDVERFSPSNGKDKLRRELFPQDEPRFIVSYAGQLIPDKGVTDLLDAARIILQKRTDVLFLIVGLGPQMTLLQDRVREWGSDSHIRLLGNRNDVEAIFRASDVAVFPSVWQEAFGFVIAEAMACGTPVVATRVGGIPEVVKDLETGILVPPHNSSELAKAINGLLDDEETRKRFGASGIERSKELFSIKKMVSETIKVYQETL